MNTHWNNKETRGFKLYQAMSNYGVAPKHLEFRYNGLDSEEFTWEIRGTSITDKVASLLILKDYKNLGLKLHSLDDVDTMINGLNLFYG